MQYVLGNMLNGGGINPDGLSLDLQFATDKTLTARRGPTPTFARASAATEVGPDGLIRYAPENLALQSEDFGTTWGNLTGNALTLNDALSPTGTLTADRIDFPATAATGLLKNIQQNFGSLCAGSGPVTASVWLRTVSGTSTVYLTLLDGGPWQRVHVACNVTTEWTRFSVTLNTPLITLYLAIGPDTRTSHGTPVQPAVQDAASIYAWGAQVERHPTARAYIPTTTAAVYGPRFDHDPITLACKGLLIEEGRTNLKNGSQDFSNTYWSGSSATRNNNNSQSPDGTTTACLVTGAGTSYGGLVRAHAVAALASTTYTWSCFAKAGTHNFLGLAIQGAGNLSGQYSHFNLSTGVATAVTSSSGTVVSASMTPFPNGWYRCVLVYTTASNPPPTSFIDISITQSNGQHDYSGTGNLFIWGAQLEVGSFPTSYIPTTTGSVVRSADVCDITGGDFSGFYNQSEGTVVAVVSEFRRGAHYLPIVRFAISSNVGGNRFQIGTNGNKTGDSSPIEFIGVKAGVTQYQSFATSPTPESRAALAYKTDDIRGALNGILSAADSPPSEILAGANLMAIGTLGLHIESIRYYRKRLPDAKLQALTV
jgi:hypothetical protein